MLSRAGLRATQQASLISRRGFQSSSRQLGSSYHYPNGPRSNLPFDVLSKTFGLKYTVFCVTGFGIPFAIAYWQLHKTV